jgi:hypothetical protein
MKRARVRTRIGDVFCVRISEQSWKYFQYIANDLTQLNADVIRAFTRSYSNADAADMSMIVEDEVAFYAHVVIHWGIEMGLWEKVGNVRETGDLRALFRNTSDYGCKVGETPVAISHNWYVWRIGEESRRVGRLEGENRKAEIGVVVTPPDIVKRMQTGKYSFVYPDFE